MDKQGKINLILSIAAIIISIGSVAYTIYHDYKLRNIAFDNRGLQNRPLLKFEEKLDKIHYTLQMTDPISINNSTDNKTPDVKTTLTVDPELKITNTGNEISNLLAHAVTDKYSGESEIRKKLLGEKEKDSILAKLVDNYYKTVDILQGQSYSLRAPHKINDFNTENSEFTMHYMIIYKNDIGNVYDSYFWVRFKVNPIKTTYLRDGSNLQMQINLDGAIQVVDTHFTTHMYSREDSNKILKIIRHYAKLSEEDNNEINTEQAIAVNADQQ